MSFGKFHEKKNKTKRMDWKGGFTSLQLSIAFRYRRQYHQQKSHVQEFGAGM